MNPRNGFDLRLPVRVECLEKRPLEKLEGQGLWFGWVWWVLGEEEEGPREVRREEWA